MSNRSSCFYGGGKTSPKQSQKFNKRVRKFVFKKDPELLSLNRIAKRNILRIQILAARNGK